MKDNSEMTKEELIALGWVKNPLDKMQEKTEKKLTVVEWLEEELKANLKKVILEGDSKLMESLFEQAKEMEREQSNAKIQKAIEVFEEAKSKAITIEDMFYYLDIVLVALEGIKNETFKSE